MQATLSNLTLLTALWIGYCWLWVAFVNRVHSLRITHSTLDKIRKPHDLAIPLGPFLIFGGWGFFGPKLLNGGTISDASTLNLVLMAVCGLGFLGFALQVIQHWFHILTSKVVKLENRIVDFEKQLGRSLIGKRFESASKILSLPGNQIFQMEFNTKTFHHANLPEEWKNLRVLHVSDLHFFGPISRDYFEAIFDDLEKTEVDLIIFSGDLIDNMDCLDWISTTLAKLSAPLGCYYILGNHDWNIHQAGVIRKEIEKFGWLDLAGKTHMVSHEGKTLALGGSEMPWMGEHPDFSETSNDAFCLLVCHSPDYFNWAAQQNVDLMLSGHNHGGQIRFPVIGPIYAPSWYGVKYASGDYQKGSTLLHVSRGVSACHPVRLNCRPEITILELVSEKSAASESETSEKMAAAAR